MAFPPKDLSARELFIKLTETPRPSEVIDWPRKVEDLDGNMVPVARVRIRVLTMRDHDEARLRAHLWLREERKISADDMHGPSVREVYGDAVAREVLARSIVSEEPIEGSDATGSPKYSRIFAAGKDLEKLTADELTCLFQAYQLVQEKYGPYEGNLASQAEVTAWTKRLVEGAALSPLSQASSHQLADLNMYLAQRVYTLSQILESLVPSLDESLVAALSTLDIGIGLFTTPVGKTVEETISKIPLNPLTDAELTIEKAVALVRRRSNMLD